VPVPLASSLFADENGFVGMGVLLLLWLWYSSVLIATIVVILQSKSGGLQSLRTPPQIESNSPSSESTLTPLVSSASLLV
jgi:hypothetical protein